jgi:hypothetical protein
MSRAPGEVECRRSQTDTVQCGPTATSRAICTGSHPDPRLLDLIGHSTGHNRVYWRGAEGKD